MDQDAPDVAALHQDDEDDEVEDVEEVEEFPVEEPEEPAEPETPQPAPAGNGATPAFAAVLDGHPGVAAWQAELRTVADVEELFVFFSAAEDQAPVAVLTDLAEEVAVTQFVVLSEEDVLDRLARHDHRQVVDLRGAR
jgi:hypothetical protein